MPLAESLTTASKVAPPAREKATAAPGSDALNDGLRDNLTDTLVPAHMASAAFRKETNQTVGRRGEGLQRVESLIDGVGMASRMVDEAGPAERTAALGELLATTLEAIKQMKAWRVKHPKKRRWKQMQPYLTELSAIALTLDINDVEPGAPVVGQAVVEPDSTKMRTAKGTIDASSDTGKESADDYEDDSVKSIAREGLDVLGAASDNTAAGADIGHEGYIELNSQGGNAMQVVDGYALGARGGADIGLGLRQMVDGDDARTKVEGGVRAAGGLGTAVQGGAGTVAALSGSDSKAGGAASQIYGGSGMVGSAASGLLGLNDIAKSGTKLAQDHGSMSRDEVANEVGGMAKNAVDVGKAGADLAMNFQKAVGASAQTVGAAAQVSGALAVASGGVDVIAGLLSAAKSAWRKQNLGKAREHLAEAKLGALQKSGPCQASVAESPAKLARLAQQVTDSVVMRDQNAAQCDLDIEGAGQQLRQANELPDVPDSFMPKLTAASKHKQALTMKRNFAVENGRVIAGYQKELQDYQTELAQTKSDLAKLNALLAEITSLESDLKVGPGGDDVFDSLKKVHNRSQGKAALKAAQGTLSVVSGALILSGVGAPVAIGIAVLNGLISVGGMTVDYGRKSKADTLMKLAGRMDDAGSVSGSDKGEKAGYRLMEKRLTKSYYRYYDHSITQQKAPGFSSDEWDGVRNFVAADKTFGRQKEYPNRLQARLEGRKEGIATETQGVIQAPKHEELKRANRVSFDAHKSEQARDTSNGELAEAIMQIASSAFDHTTQAFVPTQVTGTGGGQMRSETAQALLSNIGVSESTYVAMWRKNGGWFVGDTDPEGGAKRVDVRGPNRERMLADVTGKIGSL